MDNQDWNIQISQVYHIIKYENHHFIQIIRQVRQLFKDKTRHKIAQMTDTHDRSETQEMSRALQINREKHYEEIDDEWLEVSSNEILEEIQEDHRQKKKEEQEKPVKKEYLIKKRVVKINK